DVIRRIYERLFSVELLHAGYVFFQQNMLSESVRVKPDKETAKLFKNHGINYRFSAGTLVCTMMSDQLAPPAASPVLPSIEFTGNVRMRFMMYSSADFLNRTQVVAAGSAEVYQFSNQANAGTNSFIAQHETGVNNDDLKTVAAIAPEEKCFAVIDIHNNGAVNAAYDLFGGDKRLLSPAYKVRFAPKP
ncbi:MAG: hypothetical protein WCF67_08775, partial [Chitinophagaceae bacterium]